MAVGEGEKFYGLDGYEVIGGTGGFIVKEKGSVVSILIRDVWKGRYVVLERCQWKIGVRVMVGEGKSVDIWNVYLGQGRHERFKDMKDDGNVVWLGDFNAWSKRWGGEESGRNREGRMVEEWLDEWGLRVGNEVGKGTRYEGRNGVSRVLDLAVYGGGVRMDCKVGDGVVGLDHRPLEVEVELEGWRVEEIGWRKGGVDWRKFEGELKVWGGKGIVLERGSTTREKLEEVVGRVEEGLRWRLERCRGRRKWESGRKRWWDSRLEEKRKLVREKEKRWQEVRGEEEKRDMKEERKEYRVMIEEKKAGYWLEYLEGIGKGGGFKFVKTDRDFMVDIPSIRGENGELVEDDGEKGKVILRSLGKREELCQEEEGYWMEVRVEEDMIREKIWKEGDGKAAGVNGLSGKVMKVLWEEGWGKEVVKWVVERSLGLGYVPRQFRESIGVVMRKPKKEDYSLPSSYRVINLLDVWSKLLERVVVERLGVWEVRGLGEEQWGGRRERSSLEAVGGLMMDWERGGGLGLLLCMDVKGGYENVGVRKMEERLKGLGVDEYLRRWVGSFLRERRSKVKIGNREGEWTWLKGGTIQGFCVEPYVVYVFAGRGVGGGEERRGGGGFGGSCGG